MRHSLRTRNTFLAIVFLGLFAMATRNVTDPDLWWHLKTGQFIVEHKSIPHMDPFSYTRAGEPWVAHEWLTEILLYELERTAGWGGLIVFFAAMTCAAFFLLYLRCGPHPYIAGMAALCAAWATAPVWGVRPQVLSLLLTSLWLLILERSDSAPKLLWWTLPLTVLWVNLHAGFAVGLVLSALFLVGERIEGVLGWSQQNATRLWFALFIFGLDLLVVPLNPNGLRMFSYPIETLRSDAMQNYIAEWASPNFHRAEYWPFLLVVLGVFVILGWSRRQVRLRDLLLVLVSLYAGLCSIRMMPLFVLIAVPLISKPCREWPVSSQRPQSSLVGARSVLNGAIVMAMAAFSVLHITHVIWRQPQAEAEHFPAGAVAFLQTHPTHGPIFNHYDWGGYLIWKLYPSTQVFIDGRADLYGEPLLHQFADTYQFKGAWRQSLQRWNIDTVLVPADSSLATGLRRARGWTVSYEDPQAIILTLQPDAIGTTPTPGVGFSPRRHERRTKLCAEVTVGMQEITLLEPFAGYYEWE
jgi:hypothetical protein